MITFSRRKKQRITATTLSRSTAENTFPANCYTSYSDKLFVSSLRVYLPMDVSDSKVLKLENTQGKINIDTSNKF